MDCSLPVSSLDWIPQARILERVAISFSRYLLDPGIDPTSPALTGGLFTIEHIYIYIFFSIIVYHRILNIVPGATPQDFVIYLFCT